MCNHIIVNRVIWLLTERQIYCVCERRLKYIGLLKGLPAVHHCHLTHVECEVPSQQPLGGHLLPPLTNRATYTHKSDTPNSYLQRRKRMFTVAESNHSGTLIAMYTHTPGALPKPPETVLPRMGLVPACQNEHLFLFSFFFSFFLITFISCPYS